MKRIPPILVAAAVAVLMVLASPMTVKAESSLFINLTSYETPRAAMAIMLAQKSLAQGIPSSIFLNVEGVRLADMSLPMHKHITGVSPRDMLKDFMSAGGKVFVCQMCRETVGGYTEDEMLKGAVTASEENLFPVMFAEGVTALSY